MDKQLWAALALAACATAQAQAVYRCGETYSQQPCAGGHAVAADPAPPPDQRRAAIAATQRDARAADAMEAERLKQEARPAQAWIPPPKVETAPEPHKWPEKAATRKLDVFTASAPGTQPPKKGKAPAKGSDKKKKTDSPASAAKKDKTAGVLSVSR